MVNLVAAPRQRNTDGEKTAIGEGMSAAEIWPDKPAKARQKDVDGRWTNPDSVYRSAENEVWLEAHEMDSRIHRKEPRGHPMPKTTRRANAAKSAVLREVIGCWSLRTGRIGLTCPFSQGHT